MAAVAELRSGSHDRRQILAVEQRKDISRRQPATACAFQYLCEFAHHISKAVAGILSHSVLYSSSKAHARVSERFS